MSVVSKRSTPDRSLDQRRAALERANLVRMVRAELKRDIKAGRRPPRVLMQPCPELETMRVLEALLTIPKVGRVKAQKALSRAGVSPSRTLGGMTRRQREDLAVYLPRLR